MRLVFFLCSAVFVLTGACGGADKPACAPAPAPASAPALAPTQATVDAEVARTLDDWHDAAARADEARYFGHFAEGAVFLGTDGTERWTLPQFRAYAHPHFAAGKAWAFRATRREVTFAAGVAWFDEDLATPHLGPARGSGVLLRDGDGAWKIAQYNLSVPIPNERFADVRALIEGKTKPAPPNDHGY
jgi:ketosteroid isomerase-like protein